MKDGWQRRAPAVVAVLSAMAFVVFVAYMPVAILADASYDDAWFWWRGETIASGDWLGAYDKSTLMKGPGYPLFLAFTHLMGLSLMTTQALLYAAACLLLGTAVQRISGRTWLALLVVLALQWHPAALVWNRVLRDNIGAAQLLIALACLLHFLHACHAGRRGWGWAGLAGLVLGWMWTTREDVVWVVPGVLLLLLAAVTSAWRIPGGRRRAGVGIACVALAFGGWMALVATTNLAKYGAFVTVETREGAYADAMSALQRVRVGEPVPYVPVPAKVREAVYAVSPAFARLRPHLEVPGSPWTRTGCRLYPHSCGDYAGGWFMWALRDAVSAIGVYRSAPEAEAYYRQVADEINAACEDRRLHCATTFVGSIPPIAASQWQDMPGHLAKALSMLAWQRIGEGQTESHVKSPRVRAMWKFVGEPRVPDPADTLGVSATGWFRDPQGGWVQARCKGVEEAIAIERLPSPDIARHFKDPGADRSRFAIALPTVADCAIEPTCGTGSAQLAAVAAGTREFAMDAGRLRFDSVHESLPQSAEAPMSARWIRHGIGLVYAAILPWLSLAGLLAFAWASIRALRRRRIEPLYALAAAAWCLAAARAGMLALVEMSSFPALHVHYMQPGFPMFLLAAIVSLALVSPLLSQWHARRQGRATPS
ncbi:hypothetical protein [Luteimonas sp. A649]